MSSEGAGRGSVGSQSARKGHKKGHTSRHPRVQIGQYILGKTLGIGSFGKVKLAEHVLTGQLVAIKILNRAKIKNLDMEEKVRREIQILRLFVHPHIIRLYEVIETPTDIFLVMEYVSGGELFDFIVSKGRLPVDEARSFFQQIISGVACCHNVRVVHRDLKPENLLLSGDFNVKVADFGLSNLMYDGDFLRTSCGSPNYAAPEVISGNLYAGPEVDIWSCGVILYALLCGSLPFDDDDIPKLFKKIKNGHYTLPGHLDEGARDLISRMLIVDPTQRIKMEEIRKHRWFQMRLPPYLALPVQQQSSTNDIEELNEECIELILKLDHPFIQKNGRSGVKSAIRSDKLTFIRVIYNLYMDQMQTRVRVAEQRASVRQQLEDEDRLLMRNFAFSPPSSLHVPKSCPNGPSKTESVTSAAVSSMPGKFSNTTMFGDAKRQQPNTATAPSSPTKHSTAEEAQLAARQKAAAGNRGRKWYLGIQSKKDPELVMSEVFRALKSLRSQWQYVPSNPYRVTCRWRPSCVDIRDPNIPDEWVYVTLQLYKVQASIYLLDFQRAASISGSFTFMRLCSLIINALKAPSSSR